MTKADLIRRLDSVPDDAIVLLSTEGYLVEATDVEAGNYPGPGQGFWRDRDHTSTEHPVNAVVIAAD